MDNNQYFIGLMSGTSLDGVDIALVQISTQGKVSLIDFACLALPPQMTQQITEVSMSEFVNVEQLGQLNVQLAKLFAEGCNKIIQRNDLTAAQITAIGCHGITIRHCPDLSHPFTLQITEPNTLAALTGIDVIADFRGMDMALGGQGAPLVPKFHQALLAKQQEAIFINLGGIANITVIENDKPIIGYDTGPANTLLNIWCQQHTGQDYDHNGDWARSGQVCEELLTQFLADEYFARTYPKSTGKEKFNMTWLQTQLSNLSEQPRAEDVQATLLLLTATSVAQQVEQFTAQEIFLCGGGAQNLYLVEQLKQQMPWAKVENTQVLGLGSDEMEAVAFAWFAYCRVNNISANLPSVTGARANAILGAWYSGESEYVN